MSSPSSPYRGTQIALGTMHAKKRALATPLARLLGSNIIVPRDVDTDAFGTFTGKTERTGSMLDAARAKARLGTRIALPRRIASKESYGPHPHLRFRRPRR